MDTELQRTILALVVAALVGLSAAAHADFERSFEFDAHELRVASLIGKVDVRPTRGDQFRVLVHVQGEDAAEDLVSFDRSGGRRAELAVLFPISESNRYVYPPLGSRSRTKFHSKRHDSILGQLLGLGRDQIEVRGRPWRNALELWADLVIEVPEGRHLSVYVGVGALTAQDIHGDLELDTNTGRVEVEKVQGNLRVDTGSGGVTVRGVVGDCDVDTGSGSVRVGDVKQASVVRVDTGSGSVTVEDVQAETLSIDTGSGGVEVDVADVDELSIDTGSGGVDAYEIAANGVSIDTGSGGVRLELVRTGAGRYVVDTGSGGIRVHLPRQISAAFQVDSGSGGIDVEIDGVHLGRRERRRGEARFTVGEGESRFRLSTGSGTIRIIQARRG